MALNQVRRLLLKNVTSGGGGGGGSSSSSKGSSITTSTGVSVPLLMLENGSSSSPEFPALDIQIENKDSAPMKVYTQATAGDGKIFQVRIRPYSTG